MRRSRFFVCLELALAILLAAGLPLAGQKPFTLEQILSYPFSYELVSAKKADRLAWLEFEQGKRNVFTAAAPDFKPVRLTSFMDDDGTELTGLAISDDGLAIVFVRGSDPNRAGLGRQSLPFSRGQRTGHLGGTDARSQAFPSCCRVRPRALARRKDGYVCQRGSSIRGARSIHCQESCGFG